MNSVSLQRFCSWCGIISVAAFFGGLAIAGWIPPPSPSLSGVQIAAMYRDHHLRIMGGMLIWMVSCFFMCFFIGVISQQIKRIPGVPIALSYTQIAAGALNMVFFLVPPVLLMATGYRPDRPPEITLALNDVSWFLMVLPWPCATAETCAIGIAILADKGPTPVFPPWVGWYNIFAGLGFIATSTLVFVTSGPFAWNSIFPFWIAGGDFFIWFFVMHTQLLKVINRDALAAA